MPAITINADQHLILFWIFVGFFLLIGTISLLSIIGVIPTERNFHKWIITGFVGPVIGVIIFFSKLPTNSSLYINVNLIPPEDVVKAQNLKLTSGTYEYTKQSDSDEPANLSNKVELVAPLASPYWQAKFPYLPPSDGSTSRTVTLTLVDSTGRSWEVQAFYPNYRSDNLKLKSTQALVDNTKSLPNFNFIKNAFSAENSKDNSPKNTTDTRKKICLKYPDEIKFTNWTKQSGEQYGDRVYYTWRIFVDEDKSILNCIDEVQYVLHPTFPHPLQTRNDPDNKFSLELSGWGEFSIAITVHFTNGTILNTNYTLDFTKPWPK